MTARGWLWLILFLCASYSAAALGSIWTAPAIGTWYAGLRKPSFNPPNWIFGPVWTTLYFLMALSAWLVWQKAGWDASRLALMLFFAQLVLNVAWSWIFFGLHRPGLALVEVVFLWSAIVATALAFRPHSALAFWLMTPYAGWVSFASLLNFKIWQLNADWK